MIFFKGKIHSKCSKLPGLFIYILKCKQKKFIELISEWLPQNTFFAGAVGASFFTAYGEDVVVHVDYEENRLVTIDLDDE